MTCIIPTAEGPVKIGRVVMLKAGVIQLEEALDEVTEKLEKMVEDVRKIKEGFREIRKEIRKTGLVVIIGFIALIAVQIPLKSLPR
jgi:uncharacterized membrane protein